MTISIDRARGRLLHALEAQRRVLAKMSMRDADNALTAGIAMIDSGEQMGALTLADADKWKQKLYVAVSSQDLQQPGEPGIGTELSPRTFEYVSTYVLLPAMLVDGYLCISIEAFSGFFALRWTSLDHSAAQSRTLRVQLHDVEHESIFAAGSAISGGALRGETLFVPPIASTDRELDLRLIGVDGRIRHSTARQP